MTTLTFALEPGAPKELQINWSTSQVVVRLRGAEVATFHAEHLKRGFDVKLPDGTELEIRRRLFPPSLIVARNGVALGGSDDDPSVVIGRAWKQTAFWAIAYAVWGVMTLAGASTVTIEPEGAVAIGVATSLGGLAWLTRKGWVPAVGITTAVAVSYLAYWTIATASRGRSIVGVLLFLPIPLWYFWAFRILSRSSRRVEAER